MKFIKVKALQGQGYEFDSRAYNEHIFKIRDELPQAAYNFAVAQWHYDPSHHQCLHDSWIEAIEVLELGVGDRAQNRLINIHIKLLGSFHNGYAILRYLDVIKYRIESVGASNENNSVGHGDWLIDEVGISRNRLVEHEVLFSKGSISIECRDICYEWLPN